ncbi:unnamed protein product [Vitrella brassicaformis CCMP3155]|uniref:Uncharacterized protein n=2 Tax=Vitrella brassicaformis TaxID=1169539 RepID=A0A0G4F6D2_VITBC|nr:unnamed protein product [Vitrella brassicaformis CCMP3155]|eukprot:CEM07676.1 unnamed protein product [Vitrella brassicaformis CCMP3155]
MASPSAAASNVIPSPSLPPPAADGHRLEDPVMGEDENDDTASNIHVHRAPSGVMPPSSDCEVCYVKLHPSDPDIVGSHGLKKQFARRGFDEMGDGKRDIVGMTEEGEVLFHVLRRRIDDGLNKDMFIAMEMLLDRAPKQYFKCRDANRADPPREMIDLGFQFARDPETDAPIMKETPAMEAAESKGAKRKKKLSTREQDMEKVGAEVTRFLQDSQLFVRRLRDVYLEALARLALLDTDHRMTPRSMDADADDSTAAEPPLKAAKTTHGDEAGAQPPWDGPKRFSWGEWVASEREREMRTKASLCERATLKRTEEAATHFPYAWGGLWPLCRLNFNVSSAAHLDDEDLDGTHAVITPIGLWREKTASLLFHNVSLIKERKHDNELDQDGNKKKILTPADYYARWEFSGLRIVLREGDVVIFRGTKIVHENTPIFGRRHSVVMSCQKFIYDDKVPKEWLVRDSGGGSGGGDGGSGDGDGDGDRSGDGDDGSAKKLRRVDKGHYLTIRRALGLSGRPPSSTNPNPSTTTGSDTHQCPSSEHEADAPPDEDDYDAASGDSKGDGDETPPQKRARVSEGAMSTGAGVSCEVGSGMSPVVG